MQQREQCIRKAWQGRGGGVGPNGGRYMNCALADIINVNQISNMVSFTLTQAQLDSMYSRSQQPMMLPRLRIIAEL